ncbi:TetR/AcrR family transcriptional regulator [Roseomonas sp. AR75]|jgi:AcrR family transcriptional regulator|uniref:TetR/AcrR family transcriptional regulator n=1 Tax=Roseomonas sp. AR75 TaxID=2562311 RepID=UPI0010C01FEE|nr:TetR/AcrR family transcriptional regulator [Roseomonas sp. AR75]
MSQRKRTSRAAVFDRSQDYETRRAAILAEAARQFNQRGFALCSIDDIAERLRITKPAVYYYFRNKQELLYECYVQAFDLADQALDRATQEGRSGLEKMELYVRAYLLNGATPDSHIVPLREQRALPPPLRQKLDRRRRARRDRLRTLVAEGIADGSVRRCDPKVVVSAWAGAVGWILESYDPRGPLGFGQVAEELIGLLLHGLAEQAKG